MKTRNVQFFLIDTSDEVSETDRIAGDGDAFQDNHGSGDESKVVWHQEGVQEEYLVQIIRDCHEPLSPLHHGLVSAGLDLKHT